MRPLDLGTLFDVLAARRTRTRVVLSRPLDIAPDGGDRYRMDELAVLVAEAAGWLAAAGARPGDRIAVVKANHWDYVLLAAAAARIGALPALLSDRVPAESLALLLTRLDPRVLVTTGAVLSAAERAGVALAGLAGRTVGLDGAAPGVVGVDDLRGHRPPPVHRRHDDEPLAVNHTSGTTGVPKLVVHTTTTLIRRLAGFEAVRWPVLASRAGDTVASAVPFSHGRAIPWTVSVGWLAPRRMVILADTAPERVEPVLRAHRPTILEAAPAAYVDWQPLTRGADSPFRDVRLYVSTFDAMHPPTVRAFLAASRRRIPLWMQGWGQSETGPLTFRFLTRGALARRGDRHPTTRNLGRPVPTRTRVRVVDERTMVPLPPGRRGLVQVRTAALCVDYLGESDRWLSKVDGEWWNTGDLGMLAPSGAVYLADREADKIPGRSCLELEDVVADRLPAVAECTVLGVPGRAPIPVVVLRGDATLDRDAWRAAVADLPELAEPLVLPDAEVPRTGTGKVRRTELRTRLTATSETYATGRWT